VHRRAFFSFSFSFFFWRASRRAFFSFSVFFGGGSGGGDRAGAGAGGVCKMYEQISQGVQLSMCLLSWACPSCRGKTTGLIANVNDAVLLRGLLNASQAKLKDLCEIHDLD